MIKVKSPNIPAVNGQGVDPSVKRALDELRGFFTAAEAMGLFKTLGVLASGGTVGASSIGGSGSGGSTGGSNEIPAGPPPDPQNVQAVGAFTSVILTWDYDDAWVGWVTFDIYRSKTSVPPGNQGSVAELVQSTDALTAADIPPSSELGGTYYYWVQAVKHDTNKTPSAVVAANNGLPTSTGIDPDYVINQLQDAQWKPSHAYSTLNEYVYPQGGNGYAYKVTVTGTSGTTEPTWPTVVGQTVTSGSATFQCAANLMLETPFMVGLVDGVVKMVIKDTLIADACIKRAKIGLLAVDTARIADAAVVEAKVADAAITNAKIGNIIQSTSYNPGVAGWKIDKAGNCEFNGGTFRGAVTFTSSSSGYANISDRPTSLSGVNATEGTKLAGIAAGATVGAPSGTNVGSTAATTVESNAANGNAANTTVNTWKKPGYTTIDGNQIYTGDAYVDTLQIKGHAVTIPVAANQSGTLNLSGVGWTDVVTGTINVGSVLVSGSVQIIFTCKVVLTAQPGASGTLAFRIMQGASTVKASTTMASINNAGGLVAISDTLYIPVHATYDPTQGDKTYSIQAYMTPSGGCSAAISLGSLLLIGCHR